MRPPPGRPTFLLSLQTLIWRDLVVEWRTREIVSGGAAFALLVLVVFNFAIDLRVDNAADVAPGILWLGFAFAGMLGFGRSFAADRDRGTLDGLLLAPVERGTIYLARMVSNTIFMGLVELSRCPVFVALYGLRLAWGATLFTVCSGRSVSRPAHAGRGHRGEHPRPRGAAPAPAAAAGRAGPDRQRQGDRHRHRRPAG